MALCCEYREFVHFSKRAEPDVQADAYDCHVSCGARAAPAVVAA
jgi:hypothetical protein